MGISRRKGEVTSRYNDRNAPHIVELVVPLGGFGTTLDLIEAFHREGGIPTTRGQSQRRGHRDHSRWCFTMPEHAEEFREAFGG